MRPLKIIEGKKIWIWFISIFIICSLLVLLLSGSLQIKQNINTDATLDEFKSHMDMQITSMMKQYNIPGCNIALVKDGQIAWLQSYGYADLASNRVLTVDTPMSVQSISKSITAWGVMRLVEKGIIDLDTPVTHYLNTWQFPVADELIDKITVRQLLNHTSGMPIGDFTKIYDPKENIPSNREAMTEEAILMRKPGTRFSYSNVGYNILEILIEDVTGQSFSEYIGSEVLFPLGMENSFFEFDKEINPYPPTGYNLKGEPVPVYVYPSKASGGLFATANDIAKFAIGSMQDNPVLSNDSISKMYQLESKKIGIYSLVFDGYGFGHYVEKLPNGALSVSHGGQGNGIMTHLQVVPESKDAIVILTNSQRSWPFIASVLSDWANWWGFSSVGMEMIIFGQYGLCFIIGTILSLIFILILRIVLSIHQQKQFRFRILRISCSLIIFGILIWSAFQNYLFISSIFPVLSVWLGVVSAIFASILLLSALSLHLLKKEN